MMREDAEKKAFDELSGKFKHYCDEYDGLAIDETCFEFADCTCYSGDEFEKAKEATRKIESAFFAKMHSEHSPDSDSN